MSRRIAYQPCSNKVAQENLQLTILNPKRTEEIAHLLIKDSLDKINKLYPSGNVFIWGVEPNPNSGKAWKEHLNVDDVVLFNIEKTFQISARVTHKEVNRALALKLWGIKDSEKNSTWECIFFVDDINHIALTYDEVMEHSDSKPRIGFNVLNEPNSKRILEHFNEFEGYNLVNVSLEQTIKSIEESFETDGRAFSPTRNEHRYIVQFLFGNRKQATCSMCGNTYPRDQLVAAHIKKRKACSKKEKLDVENIATPMCKLGCDSLYEDGYISVVEGKVTAHPSRITHTAIQLYVNSLVGNTCPAWSTKTKKYFIWHQKAHGFGRCM